MRGGVPVVDGGQANPKDLAAAVTDCVQNKGRLHLRNPECGGQVLTAKTTMPRTHARLRSIYGVENGRIQKRQSKRFEGFSMR